MKGKQLFLAEVKQLKLDYFKFHLNDDFDNLFIEGQIFLCDEQKKIIDSYDIRILVKDDYPNSLPFVFETSKRIPNNIEWHVFPDGHCCIVTPPEESIICRKGITLEKFLTTHVVPYFHNQLFREINGYFLHERSHGTEGVQEYFKSLFRSNDVKKISEWLKFVAKRKEPSRIANCFCGSNKKYRKCHRNIFRELQNLTIKELIGYSVIIKDDNLV